MKNSTYCPTNTSGSRSLRQFVLQEKSFKRDVVSRLDEKFHVGYTGAAVCGYSIGIRDGRHSDF